MTFEKLKLRPVTYLSGSQGYDSDVPYDRGPKIDVVGFCFLDLASNYEPPKSLADWLQAGEKPIYIGFGRLPVEEPEKMIHTIVEALEKTNQRGIINKGWGGLGNLAESKDFVYLLDNYPHNWLFLQCKAVVHRWGERVYARGIGPPPIAVDESNLPKLVEAINFMLDPKHRSRKSVLFFKHQPLPKQ